MNESRSVNKIKIAAILFVVLIVLVSAFLIIQSISRQGKVAVTIEVSPSDSSVYINNSPAQNGVNYIKPGTYTFSAKRDGFSTDTEKIEVTPARTYIGLFPTPVSGEAKALMQQQEYASQRERISGDNENNYWQSQLEKYPIVNNLPYSDINGPFSIDYGNDDSGKLYLLIGDSTPSGRKAAFEWIRSEGYDPTNFEIRYDDFKNPLTGGNS